MAAVTVEELAAIVWDRATQDPVVLAEQSHGWLLCAVDREGHLTADSQSPTTGRSMCSDPKRGAPTPNFGKRVARRITDLDASVAGVALCAGAKSGRRRYEWLAVVAADDKSDVGLLAAVEREHGPTAVVGPRSDWQWRRPTPFESDITQYMDPVRAAMLRALRQGLRAATTRRRRPRQSSGSPD
jgi:hypothetical protein